MQRCNSWSGGKRSLSDERVCNQEKLRSKSSSEEFSGDRLEKLRRHTANAQYELELSDIQEIIRKLDKDNREAAG